MKRLVKKVWHVFRPPKDVLEKLNLDHDEEFKELFGLCKPYSMTSPLRLYALYQAVQYIEQRRVPGEVVECGVWKGGSAMLCAYTLLRSAGSDRSLYLYDTYAGMTEPTDQDRRRSGQKAMVEWRQRRRGEYSDWCYASLEEVQQNMALTGYPQDRLVFVQGKVEDTLPGTRPAQIALLRLDTDWYASTYHELVHLYPLLAPGGVLIIDDYGYWRGSRDAVEQYFQETQTRLLLNRIDNAGVIGVKW